MIWYLTNSFINNNMYLQIVCRKNKSLFWPIDWLAIEIMQDIIKISVSITYLSNTVKGWSLEKSVYGMKHVS